MEKNSKRVNSLKESKGFMVRIPKDLWLFLKKLSIKKEKSMNKIIIECIQSCKKNHKNDVDI